MPQVDLAPDEARAFLATLDDRADAVWTFQTFDDGKGKDQSLAQIRHGTFDEHRAWLAKANARGAGVFVTVNETDGKGRAASNVQRVRALFVDLDGSPLQPLLDAPLRPHLIIESSPQRWHAYWLLADEVPLDSFRQYQQRLAEIFGGDRKVKDLPRVMRLPGFVHRKGEPFVSRIHEYNEAPRYSLAALVLAYSLELEASHELQAKAPAADMPAPVQATGDDVLDDLADALRVVPSDEFDIWMAVGHGLKAFGERAQPLWLDWSSRSSKFDARDAERRWLTFKPEKVGYKAVFQVAKEHGWDPAQSPSIQRKRARRKESKRPMPPPPPNSEAAASLESPSTATQAPPADAPQAPPPVDTSDEALIARFELVYGKKRVWDTAVNLDMAWGVFVATVGKDAAERWMEGKHRTRMPPPKNEKRAPKEKPKKEAREYSYKLDWMLPRYALVYGSEAVFDRREHMELTLGALRAYCGLKAVRDWTDHPDRCVVAQSEVVFDPKRSPDDPSICNLWAGWPIEPHKGEDSDQHIVSRWLDVLTYVCGGEDADDVVAWVVKWIAYQLKYPGTKMKTSIIMHGPEGSGKNTVWDAIRRIFGRYGLQISQTQVESQYADWISAKLFIVGNEVLHRQEQLVQKGRLKMLVSDGSLQVERKYLPGREETNYANLVFLSNELQPLNIDPEDRRFLVIWTPPAHPKGAEFYRGLGYDTMPDSAVRALYAWFLEQDTDGFNAHTKPLMTKAKADLIDASLQGHQRFIRDWLAGELPIRCGPCAAQELYAAYLHWCRLYGERFPKPENTFAARAKKHVDASRKRVLFGQAFRQITVYVPIDHPPAPADISEPAWLADCITSFREDYKQWKEEGAHA